MSYYQFAGPVQGGFGPFEDDMRRRRKHYRDAGSPYAGGASVAPSLQQPKKQPMVDMISNQPADYEDIHKIQPRMPAGVQQPRHGGAVDLGKGPEQPQIVVQPPAAAMELADIEQKPGASLGGFAKKAGLGASVDDFFSPTHDFARTESSPPPHFSREFSEDPRAPVAPRQPKRDPEPLFEESIGPTAPQVQQPPQIQPLPSVPAAAEPLAIPKQAPRLFEEPTGQAVPVRPSKAGPQYRPTTKRRIGAPPAAPGPPPPPGGPGKVPYSGTGPQARKRRRGVRWGEDETRKFTGGRHTPGRILPWVPSERQRNLGYQQHGKWQGREIARLEHQLDLDKLHKRNRDMMQHLRKQDVAGGQLLHERGVMQKHGRRLEHQLREATRRGGALVQERSGMQQQIGEMTRAGGQLVQERGKMVERGRRLEQQVGEMTRAGGQLVQERDAARQSAKTMREMSARRVRELQEGMGREGLRAQRAEEQAKSATRRGGELVRQAREEAKSATRRGGELVQSLNASSEKLKNLTAAFKGERGSRRRAQDEYRRLLKEGNGIIQNLEKKIHDGKMSRAEAQRQIDELNRKLTDMNKVPAPAEDKSRLNELKGEIAGLRSAMKNMGRGGGGGAPIVVQGGSGGGGASSSAGGSSASSGGAAPAAPDSARWSTR